MLVESSPDPVQIAFDDDRLVDHACLLLPALSPRFSGCMS